MLRFQEKFSFFFVLRKKETVGKKDILGKKEHSFMLLFLSLYPVLVGMAKLRLFVRVRKQGSRIESVPLKRLIKLSGYDKRRWEFKDGWLILEAF
jgi:hypothetical protein